MVVVSDNSNNNNNNKKYNNMIINNPSDLSSLYFPSPSSSSSSSSSSAGDSSGGCDRDDDDIIVYVNPKLIVKNSSKIHGRGLFTSEEKIIIKAGECLFVTPPSITADVDRVYQKWREANSRQEDTTNNNTSSSSSSSLIAAIAERVLLERTRDEIQSKTAAAASVLALSCGGGNGSSNDNTTSCCCSIDVLTCRQQEKQDHNGDDDANKNANDIDIDIDEITIQQLIRHNAFSNDYPTLDTIERTWIKQSLEEGTEEEKNTTDSNTEKNENNNAKPLPVLPNHLLSFYPLAAMINHSCVPNAIRIYVTNRNNSGDDDDDDDTTTTTTLMVVHATRDIAEGEEVVWSYLPPCLPYLERTKWLRSKGIKSCNCNRCLIERTQFWKIVPSELRRKLTSADIEHLNNSSSSSSASLASSLNDELQLAVNTIDQYVLSSPNYTNELKRYITISFLQLYVNYMNVSLLQLQQQQQQQQQQPNNGNADSVTITRRREQLLQLATQLHFACVSCHNASTEHLSILHLCYELQSALHLSAPNKSKTLPKLKFWTEQLKKAHMVRYGGLGNDLASVRRVMKHTQHVLRNQSRGTGTGTGGSKSGSGSSSIEYVIQHGFI